MAKTSTIHVRIDPELKMNAELLLNQLGLTTSDAINIFLNQVILSGGLPFEIKMPRPNEQTLLAMKESAEIINGNIQVESQSVEFFFEEMGL